MEGQSTLPVALLVRPGGFSGGLGGAREASCVAEKHLENAKRPKEIHNRRPSNGADMTPRDIAEDVGSEHGEKL